MIKLYFYILGSKHVRNKHSQFVLRSENQSKLKRSKSLMISSLKLSDIVSLKYMSLNFRIHYG